MINVGISTFPTDYSVDIAILARKAEQLGYDSLWLTEHSILPVNSKTPLCQGQLTEKFPRNTWNQPIHS